MKSHLSSHRSFLSPLQLISTLSNSVSKCLVRFHLLCSSAHFNANGISPGDHSFLLNPGSGVIANMGNLIWSDWGRLVALTAGYWNLWGALWGIFYRKYFWDFIGGKLGPAGIIPPGFAAPFIQLIVTLPVIQGACVLCGALTVIFEWPMFPGTFFYRSLAFKITFYTISALLAALCYQTANASVIYLIVILAYTVAIGKGEIVGEKAPDNARV